MSSILLCSIPYFAHHILLHGLQDGIIINQEDQLWGFLVQIGIISNVFYFALFNSVFCTSYLTPWTPRWNYYQSGRSIVGIFSSNWDNFKCLLFCSVQFRILHIISYSMDSKMELLSIRKI